ncbi:bifunctional Bromodomain/Bromodomain-like superfamily/Transcription initiation factor TFIID subunit 2 [Babesia duncani]|uniref:Bifunctional Bromodomain/Bromodomain-like superfamily/Transcription initiation factor TFIID subunit 2 n=1 Tax=Babesia duncani TaxID=323732 RepID=A0AAD9PP80_9APIC|nr:bifunctional Bromodomain/Bromodomain-like superfamily/Transcription initiation factor TFIID subunit 2 [Babesia duncani]
MATYRLISQSVSANLDFENFLIRGHSKLNLGFPESVLQKNDSNVMFVLALPSLEKAKYTNVTVNDEETEFHVVCGMNSCFDFNINPEAFLNVDVLTFDAFNCSSEFLRESLLYIKLPCMQETLELSVTFEYSNMDMLTSSIYFERHWLLPKGQTAYREYRTCMTTLSGCWFPTVLPNDSIKEAEFCIEITVPEEYCVITGLEYDVRSPDIVTETFIDDGKKFCFSCNGSTLLGKGDLSQYPYTFGLFAGEFEFWDGQVRSKITKPSDNVEQEFLASVAPCLVLDTIPKSSIVYFSLKGFGHMLEPTNIATSICIETYRRAMDEGFNRVIYIGFLPVHSNIQMPSNLSANIRTQNYIDIKRCTAYIGSESMLHAGFLESLTQLHSNTFYRGGYSTLILPLDYLHTYSDIEHDPGVIESRLAIATGLASMYCPIMVLDAARDFHLDLILQNLLVECYCKKDFGLSETKLRAWARREVFAALVEYYGDAHPLCRIDSPKEAAHCSRYVLLQDQCYLLKASLISMVLESLFNSAFFLTDGFLMHLLKHRLNMNLNGPQFWKNMSQEVIKRYVMCWNAKPQNRLVAQNQLPLDITLESIVKRGVEHDNLNIFMKNLESLKMSFVFGTGCPQINQSFALQLQRKGTSMDHLIFRVDVKSLQPPVDLDSEGNTIYSICSLSGMAASNMLVTYDQLASIMQMDECRDDFIILDKVARMMGLEPLEPNGPFIADTLDFGDISDSLGFVTFSEIGQLRKKMALYQTWHDSVDLVGRDGNFAMGFGYIGAHGLQFCLGYGPIWDCVEVFKQFCDINKIADVLVDNGGTFCGNLSKQSNTLSTCLKRLPIASAGGLPYWQIILQQHMNLHAGNVTCASTPTPQLLSGGFAKLWNFSLRIEIVEDDGVREHVKRVGDLVPCSYKVNPRAERGRKKVANKAVAATASAIKQDSEDDLGLNDNRKNCYVGIRSDSDRQMIEWMKLLYIGMHPEMAQLDNRSVVARVCSKIRLPLLWLRADPSFLLIGRIRRCQSASMWEQQLHSDNVVTCQMEAACALGQMAKSENFTMTDNPIVQLASKRLEQALKRHRIHPSIRYRSLYSLICLYNRDFRLQDQIQAMLESYYQSFCTNSKNWHPSESRFILHFYRALGLLRDKTGYTPEFVLEHLCKFLEHINGPNYAIHAMGIVEAISYTCIPASLFFASTMRQSTILDRIWLLLWHLFRLDAIPGDGTHDHSLTGYFLRCLARQPIFLKMCDAKFTTEKDLGFGFDFIYFLPIAQHKTANPAAARELNHVYYSVKVHKAAIWGACTVVIKGLSIPEFGDSNENEHPPLYLSSVPYETSLEFIKSGRNLYNAMLLATELHKRLPSGLLLSLWETVYQVITETVQLMPLLYIATFGPLLTETRDLLLAIARPCCLASKPFAKALYAHLSKVLTILYGYGKQSSDDVAPSAALIQGHLGRLSRGTSMPKIASFKRLYDEVENSPVSDWQQIAEEAVGALKELPQAKWYLNDPEKTFPGYRGLVRQSMWLSKIETKAHNRQYRIPMEFKADFILIVKNAKSINKADSVYYKDATILHEQFDSLWPAIVKVYQHYATIGK